MRNCTSGHGVDQSCAPERFGKRCGKGLRFRREIQNSQHALFRKCTFNGQQVPLRAVHGNAVPQSGITFTHRIELLKETVIAVHTVRIRQRNAIGEIEHGVHRTRYREAARTERDPLVVRKNVAQIKRPWDVGKTRLRQITRRFTDDFIRGNRAELIRDFAHEDIIAEIAFPCIRIAVRFEHGPSAVDLPRGGADAVRHAQSPGESRHAGAVVFESRHASAVFRKITLPRSRRERIARRICLIAEAVMIRTRHAVSGSAPVPVGAASRRINAVGFRTHPRIETDVIRHLAVPRRRIEVGGTVAHGQSVQIEQPFPERGRIASMRNDVLHQHHAVCVQRIDKRAVILKRPRRVIHHAEVERRVARSSDLDRRKVEDVESHVADTLRFRASQGVQRHHLETGKETAENPGVVNLLRSVRGCGLPGCAVEFRDIAAQGFRNRLRLGNFHIKRVKCLHFAFFRPAAAGDCRNDFRETAAACQQSVAALALRLASPEQDRTVFKSDKMNSDIVRRPEFDSAVERFEFAARVNRPPAAAVVVPSAPDAVRRIEKCSGEKIFSLRRKRIVKLHRAEAHIRIVSGILKRKVAAQTPRGAVPERQLVDKKPVLRLIRQSQRSFCRIELAGNQTSVAASGNRGAIAKLHFKRGKLAGENDLAVFAQGIPEPAVRIHRKFPAAGFKHQRRKFGTDARFIRKTEFAAENALIIPGD